MHSERRVCPGVLHTKPPCLACLDRICGPYIGPIRCLTPTANYTRPSLQITHDDKGETSVTSLEFVDVSQPERVAGLLERAMLQRSVGATAMNEQSSRSHMVFMLHIDGTNKETGQHAKGGWAGCVWGCGVVAADAAGRLPTGWRCMWVEASAFEGKGQPFAWDQ